MKNKILRLLIGLTIFSLLLWKFDFFKILRDLLHSDPLYITLALAITPLTMHLRAIRLQKILSIYNKEISLSTLNRLCYLGFLFGVITPSKAGDFIRAYYLSKENKVPYSYSITSIFIDRISDIIILLLLANLALIYFPYFLGKDVFKNFIWLPPLVTLLLVIFLYLLTKEWFLNRTINLLEKIFRRIVKRDFYVKNKGKILQEFHTALQDLKNNKKKFLSIIFINIILWFFILLQAQLILIALDEHVNIIFTFLAVPFAVLAALLPITISGLGTRDATMVVLFSLVYVPAIPASKAISLAILFLFIGQIVPALVGGYFYLRKGYSSIST